MSKIDAIVEVDIKNTITEYIKNGGDPSDIIKLLCEQYYFYI